tara:strand:+ start:197 stop:700 length:504 start_codon:yes stop_codon:yes gene_type:complete
MKLLSTAALAIVVACAPAYAETFRATITKVEPNWGYRDVSVPTTHCQNVEVPVYGTVQGGGASGGDVLAGMIIGGLLGKGITNKDNGAAAGAVLGGVIAADKNNSRQQIVGYKTERQCQQVVSYETERYLKNNKIYFTWNGINGSAYTYNNYSIGTQIPITISIQAK